MENGPLADQIVRAFDSLSAQLQTAARFMLDRPRDVALLSMREQARQAGVQPATMTRLAKQLGLTGYDEVRALYAAALRGGHAGFAGRAGAQVASQMMRGDRDLAAAMLDSVGRQVERLAQDGAIDQILAAAAAIAAARRVYCLGLRSSHSPAWHLHYMLSLIGERSIALDAVGATGADPLAHATAEDVLFVVSVRPYTRLTVDIAEHAAARGVAIVAVTDSEVAPLAVIARHVVVVPTDGPSFFHAMAPCFVVTEILGALVAGRGGDTALATLRHVDAHLAALDTHLKPRQAKKSP